MLNSSQGVELIDAWLDEYHQNLEIKVNCKIISIIEFIILFMIKVKV